MIEKALKYLNDFLLIINFYKQDMEHYDLPAEVPYSQIFERSPETEDNDYQYLILNDAELTASVSVPTIGIGAGNGCSGQVLVTHDLLGLTKDFNPRFVRRYADLATTVADAVGRYVEDVRQRDFPGEAESY